MKQYWTYILASKRNGTLYIGVTGDLIKRSFQHRTAEVKSFTEKYGVKLLVYYETHESIEAAIVREKQMKKWNRKWKLELIEKFNPEWRDPVRGNHSVAGFPLSRE
ncbi:MAG: GIY-YIG nuclease family protein [Alphaproteobacteria bacterium]